MGVNMQEKETSFIMDNSNSFETNSEFAQAFLTLRHNKTVVHRDEQRY